MKALRNKIKRLRLQKGDILIVHHSLFDRIQNTKLPVEIDFPLPIIAVENPRDIRSVKRKTLEKALELLTTVEDNAKKT